VRADNRTRRGEPVARNVLFRSPVLEIRDNRCSRRDPGLTGETPPLPWHELTLPRQGLWYRHLGRRALPVDVHHAHFLDRGESHRVSHPAGCGDRNTGLILASATLRELLAAAAVDDGELRFGRAYTRVDDRLHAAHRLLLAAAALVERGELEPLTVETLALQLAARTLGVAMAAPAPALPARAQRDLVEAARAALHGDLDRPVSLADVAAAVGSSPFHLSRLFSAHVGVPMHRYRLLLRLRAAVELIVTGAQPLAEVAAATGFADRCHLTRLCRRHLGLSPAQLRQRLSAARLPGLLQQLLAAN
jgi:AraC-like DNA-binding protein